MNAIRYHHELHEDAKKQNLLIIVYIADLISNSLYADPPKKIDYAAVFQDALERLKAPLSNISSWFPEVLKEIRSAFQILINEDES